MWSSTGARTVEQVQPCRDGPRSAAHRSSTRRITYARSGSTPPRRNLRYQPGHRDPVMPPLPGTSSGPLQNTTISTVDCEPTHHAGSESILPLSSCRDSFSLTNSGPSGGAVGTTGAYSEVVCAAVAISSIFGSASRRPQQGVEAEAARGIRAAGNRSGLPCPTDRCDHRAEHGCAS